MKNFLLIVCFLLVSSAGFAQTTAENKTVNKLMQVMQMEQQIDESAERMFELQAQSMPQIAQFEEVMLEFFNKYINWETIGDDIKNIYKEMFTEQQMQDLIAFYQTETGQKLVDVRPELTTKMAKISQQIVLEHRAELQQKIGESMQD